MRIAAIVQHGGSGWPELKWGPLGAGVNAVYGPSRSGKSTLAGLLAHTLFGKPAAPLAPPVNDVPGDVFVESELGRHRLRVTRDEHGAPRLTVAAMHGSTADASTMRRLVGGLSPVVLAPLCAVSFREPPDIGRLLSAEFAGGFQSVFGGDATNESRRTSELAARRDLLAHELETRIAGDRQMSKELEARCREIDRLVQNEQQQTDRLEQSLQATETALAETDARLRYRRLELNVAGLRQTAEPPSGDSGQDDLVEQAARLRSMLAELAQREASVRGKLGQLQAAQADHGAAVAESQVWLTVGRQLAADLAGEVARLARATASQQCVCRDAHPRLRPISETIERQLDTLASLMDQQQRSFAAAELQSEVEHLARSQAELQRHLDHLLARRLSARGTAVGNEQINGVSGRQPSFGAADVEQLESRRLELEQQRFQLVEKLGTHARVLRDLRAQRETVERRRAGLLSVRSIEHVQRELTSVQQRLEQASGAGGDACVPAVADENPARASDFLAQLTDGGLVRLLLEGDGRRACVVDRNGQTRSFESLAAVQRDQVYLSLCLALLSSARQQGVRLPLVLDEPFERLDARGSAALAAVLDDFARQGHQVVVFAGQQAAAERLAAVGAAVHDIFSLRQRAADKAAAAVAAPTRPAASPQTAVVRKRRSAKRRTAKTRTKSVKTSPETLNGDTPPSEQSDAA